MRILFFCFLVAATVKLQAQSSDFIISKHGLGKLEIETPLADVEKILGQKFKLRNMYDKDGSWLDTAKATYKNAPITLYFTRRFYRDVDTFSMVLYGVRVTTSHFKTASGITIGSDKAKIIDTYQSCVITLFPDFIDDTYTTRSKTDHTAGVYCDEDANSMYFYMTNKKVKAIEVTRRPDDGD